MSEDRFFPYHLDLRWKPLFLALGVSGEDGVHLTGTGHLRATFGRFGLETPLDNVVDTDVTGPHRWYTAVGLRLSFQDDGITFGTNHRAGLCVNFRDPVPKVIGDKDHAALWVSVADPAGLAEAIAAR